MRYFYFNPPVLVKLSALRRRTLIPATFMRLTQNLISKKNSLILIEKLIYQHTLQNSRFADIRLQICYFN